MICDNVLYGAGTPKGLKMVLQVIKQTILTFFSWILNLEGHKYRCIGSRVTAILLNAWILLLVELHREESATDLFISRGYL